MPSGRWSSQPLRGQAASSASQEGNACSERLGDLRMLTSWWAPEWALEPSFPLSALEPSQCSWNSATPAPESPWGHDGLRAPGVWVSARLPSRSSSLAKWHQAPVGRGAPSQMVDANKAESSVKAHSASHMARKLAEPGSQHPCAPLPCPARGPACPSSCLSLKSCKHDFAFSFTYFSPFCSHSAVPFPSP